MSNLKSIDSVSPMTQSGGRGHNHKMGCKCPLCKKGGRGHNHKMGCKFPLCKKGGADPDPESDDYDSKLDAMEMGNSDDDMDFEEDGDLDEMEKGKDVVAHDDDNNDDNDDEEYDKMDRLETGNGDGVGEYKAGGSRKRKHRRSNKTRKGKKMSTHKRRKGGKRGRKTRRHKRKH